MILIPYCEWPSGRPEKISAAFLVHIDVIPGRLLVNTQPHKPFWKVQSKPLLTAHSGKPINTGRVVLEFKYRCAYKVIEKGNNSPGQDPFSMRKESTAISP